MFKALPLLLSQGSSSVSKLPVTEQYRSWENGILADSSISTSVFSKLPGKPRSTQRYLTRREAEKLDRALMYRSVNPLKLPKASVPRKAKKAPVRYNRIPLGSSRDLHKDSLQNLVWIMDSMMPICIRITSLRFPSKTAGTTSSLATLLLGTSFSCNSLTTPWLHEPSAAISYLYVRPVRTSLNGSVGGERIAEPPNATTTVSFCFSSTTTVAAAYIPVVATSTSVALERHQWTKRVPHNELPPSVLMDYDMSIMVGVRMRAE